MKKRAAIVIPVFNRCEITLSCLDRINKSELDAEIVIVDDSSTDDTVAQIQELHPEVKILHGTGDLFWTGGIEMGMQYAVDQNFEAVVWLNDDTEMAIEDLNELISKVVSAEKLVLAPKALLKMDDGTLKPLPNGCRGRDSVVGEQGKVKQVNLLSGFCVVMPVQLLRDIGLPDVESFPHYAGDSSYTLMANKAGYTLKIDGDFSVIVLDAFNCSSLEEYAQTKDGDVKSFFDVFVSKKSPYRLVTKKAMMRLKYGTLKGGLFYLAISSLWKCKYYKQRIIS